MQNKAITFTTEYRYGSRVVTVQSTCHTSSEVRASEWLKCDPDDMEQRDLGRVVGYTDDIIRLSL